MSSSATKKCKKCLGKLHYVDPHSVCKDCRQPKPGKFECPDECSACDEINSSPALKFLLKKKAIIGLANKLNSRRESQPKECLPNREKKKFPSSEVLRPYTFSGIGETGMNTANNTHQPFQMDHRRKNMSLMQTDRDFSGFSPNKVIEGNLRKGQKEIRNTKNEDSSSLSSNSSNNSESRAMSHTRKYTNTIPRGTENMILQNSHPRPTDNSDPEIKNLFSKFVAFMNAQNKDEIIAADNTETNPKNLIKVFNNCSNSSSDSEVPPPLIEKNIVANDIFETPYNSENKSKQNFTFKVSSKASDILLSSTILSFPLQAEELRKRFQFKGNSIAWPSTLEVSDLLDINLNPVPVLKLLPKVRHLQKVLFGRLNPSLPQDILSPDFVLPPISFELENKFLFARKQLQRTLLLFSMIDHYQGDPSDYGENIKDTFTQFATHLKDSIVSQANFVGLLLQDIRRELLQEAVCEDAEVIPRLIFGPVDESQFFGPYVKVLQSIVKKKGSSYCLKPSMKSKLKDSPKPSLSIVKLPSPFEIGDNVEDFLKDLKSYYAANEISELDKVVILKTVLSKEIVDLISSFFKTTKFYEHNLEEISVYLQRVCNGKTDYMHKRYIFNSTIQCEDQLVKPYANELERKILDCNYGIIERELLRDQFVFGLKSKDIQRELLDKYYFSFEQCREYASAKEPASILKNSKENRRSIKSLKPAAILSTNTKAIKENCLSELKCELEKRKLESSEIENKSAKKIKPNGLSFYNQYSAFYEAPKQKILQLTNPKTWNKYFISNAAMSFQVYCPWTGKRLRPK